MPEPLSVLCSRIFTAIVSPFHFPTCIIRSVVTRLNAHAVAKTA